MAGCRNVHGCSGFFVPPGDRIFLEWEFDSHSNCSCGCPEREPSDFLRLDHPSRLKNVQCACLQISRDAQDERGKGCPVWIQIFDRASFFSKLVKPSRSTIFLGTIRRQLTTAYSSMTSDCRKEPRTNAGCEMAAAG